MRHAALRWKARTIPLVLTRQLPLHKGGMGKEGFAGRVRAHTQVRPYGERLLFGSEVGGGGMRHAALRWEARTIPPEFTGHLPLPREAREGGSCGRGSGAHAGAPLRGTIVIWF